MCQTCMKKKYKASLTNIKDLNKWEGETVFIEGKTQNQQDVRSPKLIYKCNMIAITLHPGGFFWKLDKMVLKFL